MAEPKHPPDQSSVQPREDVQPREPVQSDEDVPTSPREAPRDDRRTRHGQDIGQRNPPPTSNPAVHQSHRNQRPPPSPKR